MAEAGDQLPESASLVTMTSTAPTSCPACGVSGGGKFCSNCGAPRAGAPCPACGMSLSPSARFCSGCGYAVGSPANARSRDRTPWIIAGATLAGLLALILVMLTRQSPNMAVAEPVSPPAEAPPDISNMSPRERFNRLYNRVMQAAQSGDEATVTRFTPMALMAYAQLDTVDADARYHMALLKVHTGDVEASGALGDSILTQSPGHLFGYMIQGIGRPLPQGSEGSQPGIRRISEALRCRDESRPNGVSGPPHFRRRFPQGGAGEQERTSIGLRCDLDDGSRDLRIS